MPIDPAFLADLVCPETHAALRLATADELQEVNDRIRAGIAENRGGETVSEPLEEGLVPSSGAVVYPIRDDIPILLIAEAISLESAAERKGGSSGPS